MDTIKLSERRTYRDTKGNISLPDESTKCLSTLTKNILYVFNCILGQVLLLVCVVFSSAWNVILNRQLEHPVIDYIVLEWKNMLAYELNP